MFPLAVSQQLGGNSPGPPLKHKEPRFFDACFFCHPLLKQLPDEVNSRPPNIGLLYFFWASPPFPNNLPFKSGSLEARPSHPYAVSRSYALSFWKYGHTCAAFWNEVRHWQWDSISNYQEAW